MENQQINAAVISQFLDDVSRCLMEKHDDINDMRMTDDNYDVEKILFDNFAHSYGTYFHYEQLPLLRSLLILMCESYLLLEEPEKELDDYYALAPAQMSLPF
jgi:hypothetical protein